MIPIREIKKRIYSFNRKTKEDIQKDNIKIAKKKLK